jgi:hypothetical protein
MASIRTHRRIAKTPKGVGRGENCGVGRNDPGFCVAEPPKTCASSLHSLAGSFRPTLDRLNRAPARQERKESMPYIPKQIRRERERVEVKLDRELIAQLEQYCQYLESDRDYVISQALLIAFQKDKGFADWLKIQPADSPDKAAQRSR